MNIGEQLKYLRNGRGWGLRELGEQTGGLSISFLSDIERNRTVPSIESIEKIANAFDMSIAVFMGGADLNLAVDEIELLQAYRANDYLRIMSLVVNKPTGGSETR